MNELVDPRPMLKLLAGRKVTSKETTEGPLLSATVADAPADEARARRTSRGVTLAARIALSNRETC
jgi:hypothetical protein